MSYVKSHCSYVRYWYQYVMSLTCSAVRRIQLLQVNVYRLTGSAVIAAVISMTAQHIAEQLVWCSHLAAPAFALDEPVAEAGVCHCAAACIQMQLQSHTQLTRSAESLHISFAVLHAVHFHLLCNGQINTP